MTEVHPCAGMTIALATMHGKETALAPAFAGLGVALVVRWDFRSHALIVRSEGGSAIVKALRDRPTLDAAIRA